MPDILELLDALESELGGKKGFFKKIDAAACMELLAEIRIELPESVREANYITANKVKILENAEITAKNAVREAEKHAALLVDESEILRRAEAEAANVLESTYAQCDSVIHRTKQHLDGVFMDIEEFLASSLNMIRTNREELKKAMMPEKNEK